MQLVKQAAKDQKHMPPLPPGLARTLGLAGGEEKAVTHWPEPSVPHKS